MSALSAERADVIISSPDRSCRLGPRVIKHIFGAAVKINHTLIGLDIVGKKQNQNGKNVSRLKAKGVQNPLVMNHCEQSPVLRSLMPVIRTRLHMYM